MDAVRDAYENLPYPHYIHPLTDLAHLAVVARLLRVEAADPVAARVLEIGCGAATSLMAMAARLPGCRFHGIDFSGPDIAAAKAVAAEARLANVTFEQADLADWTPGEARFDYIIAWGVFSWVSDAVKDRLLALVADSLSPSGVAVVSYMTYPGCKTAEALRDLLRLRTEALGAPAEKVAGAHRTLDFLDGAWSGMPKAPHVGYMRDQVARIRRKEPHFLLLDDLGVERDPCYLLQFAGWAAEHGLRYLGDAEFSTMLLENLPPASARELAEMKLDQLQTEQMIDYVTDRSFRSSLLVRPAAVAEGGLDPGVIRALYLSPALSGASPAKTDQAVGRYRNARGDPVTLRGVPLVAFMRALMALPDGFTAYSTLLESAEAAAGRRFTQEEEARLVKDLVTLYGRRQIALSARPLAAVAQLPQAIALTPLNLALAARRSLVATAVQTAIRLDPAEQAVCALLAAPCTFEQLRGAPAGKAMGARLAPFLNRLAAAGCLAA